MQQQKKVLQIECNSKKSVTERMQQQKKKKCYRQNAAAAKKKKKKESATYRVQQQNFTLCQVLDTKNCLLVKLSKCVRANLRCPQLGVLSSTGSPLFLCPDKNTSSRIDKKNVLDQLCVGQSAETDVSLLLTIFIFLQF